MRAHRAHHSTLEPLVTLSSTEGEHLRVLRAAVGDAVTVFDGAGLEAVGTITALEPGVQVALGEARAVNLEPPQPVTLAVALLKGDKLAEVVRACTELGAHAFQLLVTEHADAREIGAQKLERLRRIALEAAKQCGRSHVPAVLEPVPLLKLSLEGQVFVAHPRSSRLIREISDWQQPITALTGPEGGFSGTEMAWLEAQSVRAVTLGRRVLRAETAPVALLGALVAGEGW
jgi:16S rRNA (uracil1498-N3)-methyltransferase